MRQNSCPPASHADSSGDTGYHARPDPRVDPNNASSFIGFNVEITLLRLKLLAASATHDTSEMDRLFSSLTRVIVAHERVHPASRAFEDMMAEVAEEVLSEPPEPAVPWSPSPSPSGQ